MMTDLLAGSNILQILNCNYEVFAYRLKKDFYIVSEINIIYSFVLSLHNIRLGILINNILLVGPAYHRNPKRNITFFPHIYCKGNLLGILHC